MEVWMWIKNSVKGENGGHFWLGPQTDVNLDKDSETWRSGKYFVSPGENFTLAKPKKGKGFFYTWPNFAFPKQNCIFKT